MPYIITPGIQTTDAGTNFDSHAVETIEEARDWSIEHVESLNDGRAEGNELWIRDLLTAARDLPETGGTIGSHSRGYVIDVRFVSYGGLWKLATGSKAGQPINTGDIIDAFNGGA